LRSASTAGGSTSTIHESRSDSRQTGTLIKKIQRQEKLSVMRPPSVGPSVGATTTAIP